MKKIFLLAVLANIVLLIGGHAMATEKTNNIEKATFAGGCFWCTESDFDKIDGVISTVSGYISGNIDNPTYKQVSSGTSGHAEAVEITFDNAKVSYSELVEHFWKTIDPTVKNRQFCDVGSQYRTGIFYHSSKQKKIAEQSKAKLSFDKVYTEITKASKFYPAEDYHQDYYTKNPLRYKYYRYSCGRDKRLEDLWG